jgi:hypothetical protein
MRISGDVVDKYFIRVAFILDLYGYFPSVRGKSAARKH